MCGRIEWLEYDVELADEDELYGPDFRGIVYGRGEVWYECHAYTLESAERDCIGAIETILAGGDPYVDTVKGGNMEKCSGIYEHRGIFYETLCDAAGNWAYEINVEVDGVDKTFANSGYGSENEAAWAGMAKVDNLLCFCDIVEGGVKTAGDLTDPDAYGYWFGKNGPKKCYRNTVLLRDDNAPAPIKRIMDDWFERSRAYGDVGGCVTCEGFRFTWNGVDYRMRGQSPWQGSVSWESSIEQVADELRAIGAEHILWEWGYLD